MSTVTNTIRAQLGDRMFEVMTGARNFIAIGTSTLQFDLPARFAQDGINRVRVTYVAADDLYTVAFIRYSARTLIEVERALDTHVFGDQLRAVFTRRTGLDCGGLR